MTINATAFKKLDGTVFVVVYTAIAGYAPTGGFRAPVAQGVFKTQKAANKLRDTIRANGNGAEVRVGHFISETTIETI